MHRARLQRHLHNGEPINNCLMTDRRSCASNPSQKTRTSPSPFPALTDLSVMTADFPRQRLFFPVTRIFHNIQSCSVEMRRLIWCQETVFCKNARCSSKYNAVNTLTGPPDAAIMKQQLIPKNVSRDALPVQTPRSVSRSGPSEQRTGSQQWPSHHSSLYCTWPHRGWRRGWGNCRSLATCTWQTPSC